MKKSRVKSDTMSRSDSGCSVSTSSSLRVDDITMTDDDFTRPVNEEEVRAFRAARDKFLKQRQYRGSIFYDEMSGVAKIPLYAAPKSANMTAAPALSCKQALCAVIVMGLADARMRLQLSHPSHRSARSKRRHIVSLFSRRHTSKTVKR